MASPVERYLDLLALRDEHAAYRQFYTAHDEQLLGHVILADPVIGALNLVQWLRVQAYHDAHHYERIRLRINDPHYASRAVAASEHNQKYEDAFRDAALGTFRAVEGPRRPDQASAPRRHDRANRVEADQSCTLTIIAIPRRYEAAGVRRYGFHGLSYASGPRRVSEHWRRRSAAWILWCSPAGSARIHPRPTAESVMASRSSASPWTNVATQPTPRSSRPRTAA